MCFCTLKGKIIKCRLVSNIVSCLLKTMKGEWVACWACIQKRMESILSVLWVGYKYASFWGN